jgi:glutamate N-acetyltransferase/amino-acid N-acetyltransferase
VLPFSTGVIGEPLPVEKIEGALQAALDDLSENNWAEAATGIMTTDTLPKGASRQFQHDGVTITVTGISKGAGMIRPNMATMLGYIATDAKVARDVLQGPDAGRRQQVVQPHHHRWRHLDQRLLHADRHRQGRPAGNHRSQRRAVRALKKAVFEVCMEVAQAIVRDGEGATKFVTVKSTAAATTRNAWTSATPWPTRR